MEHDRFVIRDHHDPHVLAWLVFFLLLALAIAGLVWLVLRLAGRLPEQRAAVAAPAAAADGALEAVRLRYARGEIGRDEFARLSVDLGGAPPPP